MPLDPNIPLSVRPPVDPLESYGKAVSLAGAMQQNQMGNIQLQQARMQMNDQQTIRQLFVKNKGDIDQTMKDAAGAGVGPQTLMQLQQHSVMMRKAVADADESELKAHAAANDQLLGMATQVQNAKPEDKPAMYGNFFQQISAHPDLQKYAPHISPQYPGDEQFSVDTAQLHSFSQLVKEREVAAQEMAAQARMKAATKLPEGETPLADKVPQFNQLLAQRFSVLNPGLPVPAFMQLQPNATQKDFDQIDKIMESTERAQGTKAQQDTANAIRQQTYQLAMQNAQERQEKEGMTPVMGTDANGNSVLASADEARQMGLKGTMKAGEQDVSKAVAARHLLPLMDNADAADPGIKQLIDQLDRNGKLGPLASRWNDFLSGTFGSGDPDYTRLRTRMGLSTTLLMNAHVGSRGGAYMMEHFEDLANAGKMDAPTLKAGIDEEYKYAKSRAMLPASAQRSNEAPEGTRIQVGNKIQEKRNGQWVDVTP